MNRANIAKILVLLGAAMLAPAPIDAGKIGSEGPPNQLAEKVKEVLGVKGMGADILSPLAKVTEVFPSGDDPGRENAVQSLVKALLSGADPNSLSSIVISRVGIADQVGYQSAHDWKYGTYDSRQDLSFYLLQHAQLLAKTDSAKAAEYARAAILLPAYEDFRGATMTVRYVADDASSFCKTAALSDAQCRALRELLSSQEQYWQRVSAAMKPEMEITDTMITDPNRRMPVGTVKQAVQGLDAWKAAAGDTLAAQFDVISEAWQLRNLAKSRGNAAAQGIIDAFLSGWLHEAKADPLKRWLSEALATTGKPPTGPRVLHLKEGDPLLKQLRGDSGPSGMTPPIDPSRPWADKSALASNPFIYVGLGIALLVAILNVSFIFGRRRPPA